MQNEIFIEMTGPYSNHWFIKSMDTERHVTKLVHKYKVQSRWLRLIAAMQLSLVQVLQKYDLSVIMNQKYVLKLLDVYSQQSTYLMELTFYFMPVFFFH